MSDGEIPRGHFVANGSGLIDRPLFEYPAEWIEADRQAFEAKWKNSSTPEEIQRERDQIKERSGRHQQKKLARRLHAAGATYTQIAKQLGVEIGRAHELCDDDYAKERREQKNAWDRERRAA